MWKAVGGDKSQQPFAWLRLPHTVKFIDSLKKKLNTGKIPVLKTIQGRYGGTYAHWQIAQWPMVVNQGFRAAWLYMAEVLPGVTVTRGNLCVEDNDMSGIR